MATQSIPLKLMVHKSRNHVVYAEAGSDFVDVLLSFLTLPLATIIRLTGDLSSIGCIDNLYKSVGPLHVHGLLTSLSKSVLLTPNNAVAEKCKDVKINVDSTVPKDIYICQTSGCSNKLLTLNQSALCACGRMRSKVSFIAPASSSSNTKDEDGVFVKGSAKFLISDGGVIYPLSTEAVMSVLENLEIRDEDVLQEKDVTIEASNILLLLQSCFKSKTLFTGVYLSGGKDHSTPSKAQETSIPIYLPLLSKHLNIKLLVDKKEKRVIYAEAKRDFVDLLFSFLTFPSGLVVKLSSGHGSLTCIENVYKSISCLSSLDCLENELAKEFLQYPKLPIEFVALNNVMDINDTSPLSINFYMCSCASKKVSKTPNVKCHCGATISQNVSLPASDSEGNGGLVKSDLYLVTDDLEVKEFSSFIVFGVLLKRSCITDLSSLEVVSVDIGNMETLALLRASFAPKTALTKAFATKLG